jgi:sugar O-acyltransferase (sialic acid O-acetyltransferase NeuD family)
MAKLAIIAGTGLAREVLALESSSGRYDEAVILDDNPEMWGEDIHGARVVGPVGLAAQPEIGDLVVCVENGNRRREIVERLAARGVMAERYATVLHPSVDLPVTCSVGAGSILMAGVVLTSDVQIHRHVVVGPNAVLSHATLVRDYARIGGGAALGARARLGEASYVGMNATVADGVHLGAGSTLGLGSVLTTDMPIGQSWAGHPAREISDMLVMPAPALGR